MGGNSNNLYPPNVQNMSLHPPDYDPRRLFPFGLSPIPEVPSELASEVSSIASSPTPSYEDSDTEAESVHSRSRGSIMYSGSCDSIKSNVTLHGKQSSSESETETEHDSTEEETEDEQEPPDIPVDNTPIVKIQNEDGRSSNLSNPSPGPQSTLYNSEVTQVMHQRTFIDAAPKTPEPRPTSGVERKTLAEWTQQAVEPNLEERSEFPCDMMSGAATASEIFRHLQATRGKQEVTTELAKILTVLKTTLQTGSIAKDLDSSSSDEESGLHQVKAKNPMPVTGKPPRPPMKSKLSSISPAIQAKIKELESSKSANPKEEMNLLSKILVHLLCSCKTVAAAQELKGIIKQFKEVAKVAMEEGDDTLEILRSNSRASSRNAGRRKVRSRTASGNSNISANSETDSMNTLTPGDSKSSGTDDDIGVDPNLSKIRFTSDVGGGKANSVESSVSYTLTLPLSQPEGGAQAPGQGEAEGDEDDDEWEWEYEDDSTAVTPTKLGSSGSSRNLTPSEGKSDASTGSTRKLLTEMEMGAYNSSSTSHSEQHSTTITEEEDLIEDEDEHGRRKRRGEDKGEASGHIFCHLEETFKVLSDTYKIITTGNSPEGEYIQDGSYPKTPDVAAAQKNVGGDESFEDILDGISNQCVQLETEITRSSRESSVRQTPIRQCTASPSASPAPPKNSRPSSRTGSRMSRPGSRLKTKTPLPPDGGEEDWGDEDEWEYYYEGDDWEEEEEQQGSNDTVGDSKSDDVKSRPVSRQKILSQPMSRQTDKPISRPVSRQQDKTAAARQFDRPPSRPTSRQAELEQPIKVLTRPSSRQLQETRPASKAETRPASKIATRPPSQAKEGSGEAGGEWEGDWEWDESGEWAEGDEGYEYEYYYEETTDAAGNVTSRPVSRARIPSRQGVASKAPSRAISRAASRAEEILDQAKTLEKGASRVPSRQDVQTSRAPSQQGQQVRVPSRVASRTGERIPSRAGSRISTRPVSRAKTENGEEAWGEEDEWEYYYEGDEGWEEEGEEQPANHNGVSATACAATNDNDRKDDIPSIVINPSREIGQRPGSRGSQLGSRPSSRSSNTSRPASRGASRIGKKAHSSLGNVDEEGEYYDEYGFDEDDMRELRGSSPTLTTAPTTRATSPSMVFPGDGPSTDYPATSYSKRRISVIEEVEETTPRPGTVVARTPTNRESMTPQDALRAASKTPSFYQAQTGEVGYLNPMAGVSVALAAEYLGQDANQLAANLPADFIEQNQVILKEKRKKKHRSKDKEYNEDEEDEEERRRRRKKGRKKDGKFLPKVGVKELAARMEGELFQDMQVGTKMVITRDEARDVIRESKKKERKNTEAYESRSQTGTPSRHSPKSRKDEEKRKSVREMVQLMSTQVALEQQQQQEVEGGYNIATSQPYSPALPVSSNMPPPVPPLPQGYYSSPTPQYPQQYQQYPVEVRPQYPSQYMGGHESPYQQYPPAQQYQQYQQQYHAYQGYPPPPPPPQHYQYPPQQYPQGYPQPYPQGYPPPPQHQGYPPPPPQGMVYPSDNPNQVKVVSGGQTTMVTMRSKSQGGSRAGSQRPTKSPEMMEVPRSPVDSEAYGTGSTGSDGTEGQVGMIDHDEGGGLVLDSMGNPIKKRHSRLFKLLQDSDYTDSDTESRSDYSRISMKNVEDHHSKESDIDSVCSGLERSRDKGIDRKHSFRSHKSSNKESDNESVTSSGVERKISPNSMQKNLTTRRFMQLSLKNDYEPSSSELSTPNSPTAAGPDDKGRRRSTSKPPTRVWNYHADDFDSHAGVSDDSSYQSLQSLNSFDSIYDANAGLEVEEILKRKVQRDQLYRYQTDSPASYVAASPKTVDILRNSPKTHSASPRMQDPRATASPKFEQELLDLATFPSSPSISLRQLHSHRSFYGGSGGSK